MNSNQDVQESFLSLIKENLPNNISLSDEIADLLNISKDSAYRRLRGETMLTIDEIQKLCNKFNLSVDTILNTNNESVTFNYRSIKHDGFTFQKYLGSIDGNLKTINRYDVKLLTYLAKDIPIFHHCQFPKLMDFKCFFWLKTILNYPEFVDVKFEFGHISDSYLELSNDIWNNYIHTPSLEVWSYETINITLRQIEFYYDCGLFKNMDDAKVLIEMVEKMILHIKKMAEYGYKFQFGEEPEGVEDTFQLYSNEVNIADTTIFFKMGDTKITFITHNNLNILSTSNKEFCEGTENYIHNLLKKSSLISTSSEKERNRFFNRLIRKIEKTRKYIS